MPRTGLLGQDFEAVEQCLSEAEADFDLFFRPSALKGFVFSIADVWNPDWRQDSPDEVTDFADRMDRILGVDNFVSQDVIRNVGIALGPLDLVDQARRNGASPRPVFAELISFFGCDAVKARVQQLLEIVERGQHPVQKKQREFVSGRETQPVFRAEVEFIVQDAVERLRDELLSEIRRLREEG